MDWKEILKDPRLYVEQPSVTVGVNRNLRMSVPITDTCLTSGVLRTRDLVGIESRVNYRSGGDQDVWRTEYDYLFANEMGELVCGDWSTNEICSRWLREPKEVPRELELKIYRTSGEVGKSFLFDKVFNIPSCRREGGGAGGDGT